LEKKLDGLSWVQVAHTCNPSYSGGRDQEDGSSKPSQANGSQDPILKKYSTQKWAGGVVQIVEHLPNKCEALSSNPSTEKKKDGRRAEQSSEWDGG
jgi:hypothetical protein